MAENPLHSEGSLKRIQCLSGSSLKLIALFTLCGQVLSDILPSIAKHNTLCFAGCAAAAKAT